MNTSALILPGIGNSDSNHWQSLWEKTNPSFARVQQRDWDYPVCDEWVAGLEKAVAQLGDGAVLIAHSLACLLVAHWASRTHLKIKGALLVAPPNPDGPSFPKAAVGFCPLPLTPLVFPSIVAASVNDPYASVAFTQATASAWGSRFVSVGAVGHINSHSGLGEWHEGFALFQQLAANVS